MAVNIPLRQWIKGALKVSEDRGSLSSAYLNSSLRIAVFITKQIREAENPSSLLNALDVLPPPFPVTCMDWADCVTVNLNSGDQSLPFDSDGVGAIYPGANERADTVDALIDECARYLDEDCAQTSSTWTANSRSYLDVDWAQLSCGGYENNITTQTDSSREKLHRIYSLGLVFYELFSGGLLPPPDLLVVSSPNGGDLAVIGEGLESTDFGTQGASVDFAGALNISDGAGTGMAMGDVSGGSYNSNIGGHCTDSISNKRRQSSRSFMSSRQGHGSSQVLCHVSTEPLKMQGVPAPLCELVCNMIDAVNGNFRGNDTYNEISDVTEDLELMLYKPSLYLHDLDVEKLSRTGLELDGSVFAQDDEFAALQGAYQISLAGSCELAVIAGKYLMLKDVEFGSI